MSAVDHARSLFQGVNRGEYGYKMLAKMVGAMALGMCVHGDCIVNAGQPIYYYCCCCCCFAVVCVRAYEGGRESACVCACVS